jgi:hypothetical protein
MRPTPRRLFAFAVAAALLAAAPLSTFASTAEMATAAKNFLAGLDPAQTAKAVLPLNAPEREKWFFVPIARDGVPLKAMTAPQQELARALLRSGLSQRGAARAETIITLENVLREIEKDPVRRDPSLYYVTIFGDPAKTPWGWRFEGHHLSLNFTIFDAERVAITPSFFGTNPAEVRDGPMKGTRVLAEEEDLGLALVNSLDAAQRAVAIIAAKAPNDILTSNKIRVEPLSPAGISASAKACASTPPLCAKVRGVSPGPAPAPRMNRPRRSGVVTPATTAPSHSTQPFGGVVPVHRITDPTGAMPRPSKPVASPTPVTVMVSRTSMPRARIDSATSRLAWGFALFTPTLSPAGTSIA